jgi:hypothetical protein
VPAGEEVAEASAAGDARLGVFEGIHAPPRTPRADEADERPATFDSGATMSAPAHGSTYVQFPGLINTTPRHTLPAGGVPWQTRGMTASRMSKTDSRKKALSPAQRETLLKALKARFEKHMNRHRGLAWADVQARLEAAPAKLWSLHEMERTGGEPDVVGHDRKTGEFIFYDCAAESPEGRRSACYDREGLESRKEHRPANTALDMAATMGIEILTETQYRELQELGEFDTKTSSWVKTPPEIRALGGAVFCDRRYDQVFTYHNGAQSYYAGRGFRGALRI